METIRMEEKQPRPMGLTNKGWAQFEEILNQANKDQIKEMILIAALKLPKYRVDLVEKQ
jgi:hypothetical protein